MGDWVSAGVILARSKGKTLGFEEIWMGFWESNLKETQKYRYLEKGYYVIIIKPNYGVAHYHNTFLKRKVFL